MPNLTRILQRVQHAVGLSLCRAMTRPLRPAPAVSHPVVDLRLAGEAELLPLCDDPALELRPAQVRAAFRRGDLCVGAWDGRRLAGYQWLAFGPTPHVGGVWVDFAPGGRYSYKGFVHPDYRGQRIHPAMNVFTDRLCLARGATHALAFIEILNLASVRASRKSGHRVAGYAGFWQWNGRFVAFRTPGAARLGFRFFVPEREAAPAGRWSMMK